MSASSLAPARQLRAGALRPLGLGSVLATYLGLIVLLPLAALVAEASGGGLPALWRALTQPEAVAAMGLTLGLAAAVALVDALVGTAIAWELVRDRFRGQRALDALIDLPFALPTIVAGLVLLALYGPDGALRVDIADTRLGVLVALLFVTLPFVVRSVQPVLEALGRDMEEAAATLGAGPLVIARRIVLPHLLPAVLSGAGLAFARAIGEYGAVVLISGNLPMRTEVASVYIASHVESFDLPDAAALSVFLLALSLVALVAVGYVQRRMQDHAA